MAKRKNLLSAKAVYYCKIDTYRAVKDYQRNGRCLRLAAIAEKDYKERTLESADGVETMTLDIDYWEYCRLVLGRTTWLTEEARQVIDSREGTAQDRGSWYRVELEWGGSSRDGYGYKTFSEDPPRFFKLISCEGIGPGLQFSAPSLPGFQTINLLLSPGSGANSTASSAARFNFLAFHVGQGMCSLITDGKRGVLLDLGAGTPITRPRYQKKKLINQLADATKHLVTLDLVISHADEDHWRILAWDQPLRKRIGAIYIPKGAKALSLKDPEVIHKTVEVEDIKFVLSSTCTLDIWRSQPSFSDDNGECLVAVFEESGKRALASGDYVYRRFADDHNPRIKAIHEVGYDAVIVPHHGDLASADQIVAASSEAFAFFSAGTHGHYNHPTNASKVNHAIALFSEICDRTKSDILQVQLI